MLQPVRHGTISGHQSRAIRKGTEMTVTEIEAAVEAIGSLLAIVNRILQERKGGPSTT